MISWHPIADVPDNLTDDDMILLWCPELTISGPAMVAYRSNDEWVCAATGEHISALVTHYSGINPPGKEDDAWLNDTD